MTGTEPHLDARFLSRDLLETVRDLGRIEGGAPDEVVLVPGQTDDVLMIMLQGRVEMFRYSAGQCRRLGIFKTAGQVISVSGFYLRRPNPLGAMVVEADTQILCLPRDIVMSRLLQDPVFAKYFIADIADQHMAMVQFLSDGRDVPALKRIARRIRDLSADNSEVEITQSDLAEMIGVTRITVSKVLGELENERVLERSYGRIRILDKAQLGKLAA